MGLLTSGGAVTVTASISASGMEAVGAVTAARGCSINAQL